MITVKDFCKKYDMKAKTVYKRIAYHKNGELAGHVVKIKGKPIEFDEFAEDFLKSIKVKIREVVDDYERILNENNELTDKVENLEYDNEQLRAELEKCKAERDNFKEKADRLEIEIKEEYKAITERDEEIKTLESALETKKNESIFEHIKGKNK